MSNALEVITRDINGAEDAFNAVLSDPSINFKREAEFAIQILQANDYALKIATNNRQSVVNAVTNLAAIGISLNPAKKQAYLVPRKNAICVDISYMGMVELAVASGSVMWVKAELVRASDDFVLNGFDRPPTHNFKPFDSLDKRGEIVGVYCVVKTATGDYLTDTMPIEEVYAIRDRSESWKNGQKGPWKTDPGEMIKKTMVKRASKMWPKTERLLEAIHHLNTEGGEGLADIQRGAAQAAAERPIFDLTAWMERAGEATDTEELRTIYKEGSAAATKAKNLDAHATFKAFVVGRAELLKGKAAATDVEVNAAEEA